MKNLNAKQIFYALAIAVVAWQVRSTGGALDAVATESAACVFFSAELCFFYVFAAIWLAGNAVFDFLSSYRKRPK
ncbi:hypothetical protein [uncultured Treponema sp.]|uniref:hypothetical protein n=1 Tax=uncultured Treponema sp. TaxID=162155 RepID=UPI0025ED379B|nr:hypothetical protein [uncultured Treponema sp.]